MAGCRFRGICLAILGAVIALPAGGPAPARAGDVEVCVEDGQRAFGLAVHQHFGQYRSLATLRGVVAGDGMPPDASAIKAERLIAFIGADLAFLQEQDSGRPVVLFYAQDSAHLCGFLLTPDRTFLYHRLPLGRGQLSALQQDWRYALEIERLVASRAPRKRAADVDDALRRPPARSSERIARESLSAALLPPEFAHAIPRDAELIVVPTNDIGTVPFALLQLSSGERLVERAAVTVAANLWQALLVERGELLSLATDADAAGPDRDFSSWLPTQRNAISPGWQDAVLVGDPDATSDPEWDFPPLPGARREVEEITDWLASDPQSGPARHVLTGEHATKAAVLAAIAEKPQLIYVAAHGIADAEEPLDGFIALSGGRLTAREVQSTLTNASLVVLSACQTGLGRAHAGGVIGLARGFQLGGAVAVVMSLWNVDDEATRRLMTDFMKRVGHVSPSEALRQAMLALRLTHPDPMLWGGFQTFGSLLPARR